MRNLKLSTCCMLRNISITFITVKLIKYLPRCLNAYARCSYKNNAVRWSCDDFTGAVTQSKSMKPRCPPQTCHKNHTVQNHQTNVYPSQQTWHNLHVPSPLLWWNRRMRSEFDNAVIIDIFCVNNRLWMTGYHVAPGVKLSSHYKHGVTIKTALKPMRRMSQCTDVMSRQQQLHCWKNSTRTDTLIRVLC